MTTTHLRISGHTACGIKVATARNSTLMYGEVTCRRCQKSIPGFEEVVIEPNLDAFTKAMKAFGEMIAPVLDLQTRMMNVGKKIADANTAHDSLSLTAHEVESLALLLYFLGQSKK